MNNKLKKALCTIIFVLFVFGNMLSLNAASGSISVSSNTNSVVVGNTFNVTISLSSSVGLGTWEWTVDYDKSKLKLTSGESNIVDYSDGSKRSASYSYTFKAIGSGSGTISVKSYSALAYSDTSELSLSVNSKTVNIITEAEKQASYSKNNYLSSLGVDGYDLSPAFDKETLDYTVSVGSNVENVNISASVDDSKSNLSGTGSLDVAEGKNKVSVTVTAQNGSTRTYNIIINVKDENPIETTIDNKKYTVVKRASLLTAPTDYSPSEITINDITVPSFYSEVNKYNLVGLKDTEGNIELYIYNEKDFSYTKYAEAKLDQLTLQPLEIEKEIDATLFVKCSVKINGIPFNSYRLGNTKYYVIYTRNLNNGKDDYYLYNTDTKNVIKYTDSLFSGFVDKNNKYYKIILLLGGETALVFIILLIILIVGLIKNRKKKKLYKEEQLRTKLKKEKEEKEEKERQELEEIKRLEQEKKDENKDDAQEEKTKTIKKTRKSKK